MDFIKYFQQLRNKQVQHRDEKDRLGTDKVDNAVSDIPDTPAKPIAESGAAPTTSLASNLLNQQIDQNAKMIAAYHLYPDPDQQSAIQNLFKIKLEIDKPKESALEHRAERIKENLGSAECHQAIREERWGHTVFCPYCYATDIERLPPHTQIAPFNFKYLCLACHSRFNDDSLTPFEIKPPTLETWMECWFLLGCTDSLEFIANKLHLDVAEVKYMVAELKKSFHGNQPLAKLSSYENWHHNYNEKIATRTEKQLSFKKKQELYRGETTEQAKDTAELRRQKSRKVIGPDKPSSASSAGGPSSSGGATTETSGHRPKSKL